MKEKWLSVLTGILVACSLFIFYDGLLIAKSEQIVYNYTMWIPQILSFCGIFLLFFVNNEYVTRSMTDEDDEDEEIKSKCFFFFSSAFLIGSLFSSMWIFTSTYSEDANSWPGLSLVGNSFFLVCSAISIFLIKMKIELDDEMD